MPYPSDCNRRVKEEPRQYLHARLKEVHIGGFFGSWNNIEFAIYLLRSAVFLKRLIIDSRYEVYVGGGEWSSGNRNVWSAKVRKLISDQLQGNNFYADAEVIIR